MIDPNSLDHPLDVNLNEGMSLFAIEPVEATANNIDDCLSSTSSLSCNGTTATFTTYACIISCGS